MVALNEGNENDFLNNVAVVTAITELVMRVLSVMTVMPIILMQCEQ